MANAGKKGTKPAAKGKKRNGNGKPGFLWHVMAFISGALTATGGGAAVEAGLDAMGVADRHPAVDAVIDMGTGGALTAVSATDKRLRKVAITQAAGNVVGGAGKAVVRWLMTKAPAGSGNVRKTIERKRLAQGAGNVRDTMQERNMEALKARFRQP